MSALAQRNKPSFSAGLPKESPFCTANGPQSTHIKPNMQHLAQARESRASGLQMIHKTAAKAQQKASSQTSKNITN